MIITKHVTCPETAHLEEIRYLADVDGQVLVVLRCTRFDPPQAVGCGWTCANRMNCRINSACATNVEPGVADPATNERRT